MSFEIPKGPLDKEEKEKNISSLINNVDKAFESQDPITSKEAWNKLKQVLKKLGAHMANPLKK